jgi:hypothetical protein
MRSIYRSLTGADEFTVLFLNDIHYDPNYLPTGTPENACRKAVSKPNASYAFGQYGCDAPQFVIGSLLNYAHSVVPSPDFIVIAGDFPAHDLDLTHSGLLSIFQSVFSMVSAYFPGIPIYPTMGNNDFDPEWGTVSSDPDDFENFAKAQRWLSDSELATLKKGGYFFHDFGQLRLLFLNTVMYSIKRKDTGDSDPFEQFAWIDSTASAARAAGMTVGTVMHVPPGIRKVGSKVGWYAEYAARYHDLTLRHNFSFGWSAHSHLDQFLPTADSDDRRYLLGAPAVSPIDGNNPGFRVYTIGPNGVRDYQQYFGDLLKNPTKDVTWQLEYDFVDAYRVPDGSPDSVAAAAVFARDDTMGRWQYHARLYNQAMENGGFYYCAITGMTADDILNCQKKLAPDVPLS